MLATYRHTTNRPRSTAGPHRDITMSDNHVHPVIRRLARRVNADNVECVDEKHHQHKLIFKNTEQFEVPLHKIGNDRITVDVWSVQNKRYTNGIEVTVFLKETPTVKKYIQTFDHDKKTKQYGLPRWSWDSESYRKKTASES